MSLVLVVVGFSPMAAACCGHGYCSREVAAIAESGWQHLQRVDGSNYREGRLQ